MPIPKSKRKESQFEVFHHFTQMRKKITDLLLRDFGYSYEKFNKNIEKRYGGKFYKSWFQSHFRYMSKRQRKNMDNLFNELQYNKFQMDSPLL